MTKQITIYQIKKDIETDCRFISYHPEKFNINNYEIVFKSDYTTNDCDDIEICDNLFSLSNSGRIQLNGHSLSVSDVIQIDNNYYYCQIVGWKQINI